MKTIDLFHVPEGAVCRWPAGRFGFRFRRDATDEETGDVWVEVVGANESSFIGQKHRFSRRLQVAYPIPNSDL